MIRCGWFLTDLRGGGAERVPLELATSLERTELTVVLLKDRVQHTVSAAAPPIVTLSSGLKSLALAGGPILARATWAARHFDVLVAGLEWAPTFFAVACGAISQRPVVATVHTDLHRYDRYEPVSAGWWKATRVALSRCAAVVAVSEDVRESVLRLGVPDERIHLIPNPSRSVSRAGVPGTGRPRILTVGSLKSIKGVDVALEAAAKLLDIDYEWIVVGDGPERGALIEQSERLGLRDRVTFVGFQPDPEPFYRMADLYVLPSRSEGFGIVLVEAMSAGLPIVATRCAAVVERMITPDLGVLVDNGNSDAMAGAVRSLLHDEARRRRCRQAALRRAQEYGTARAAHEYDQLLSEVAAYRTGVSRQ